MKGIIFTEFLEFVEDKYGLIMVNKIIGQSNLASNGIYTAVGTYDFSEMLQLISHLSHNTDINVDDLLMAYAEHLFAVLIKSYPDLVYHYDDPMDLLVSVENHIHVEVQKIYPDAQLPTFDLEERTDNKMVMVYKSHRALYTLGKGLILEIFKLFKVPASIEFEKLNEEGTEVRFFINKL
ncbi:heme NO-binding domain-containing protein [Winogradskyella sp.]|jgi:hypothetical protein|uniref:heme NO-binding domain-containing protein n=1 Tax=Winogradskyella sp. TaxID=1883156 RepID=UPI0025FDC85C|nr:heme NO-binding domain-containing protein [Winogradskyella sp.]MCT4630369.1 heme NO-binding domain-containing protein [Winogradskyella sp.]